MYEIYIYYESEDEEYVSKPRFTFFDLDEAMNFVGDSLVHGDAEMVVKIRVSPSDE